MNGCLQLISIADNVAKFGLRSAIYAGACAGLLAAVALAINVLFRRWLSARQMGLLWGMVLLRLLIPVAVPSPFSLQTFLPMVRVVDAEAGDSNRDAGGDGASLAYWSPLVAESEALGYSAPAAAPRSNDFSAALNLLVSLLPLVWLGIAAAHLAWTAIMHWRFCRELEQVGECELPRLRDLWESCRKQAGVRASSPILLFDGVGQPAVLGLFRPKLLLPAYAAELTDQQLRMIMLHELAHMRHWDLAAHWALVLIRALHWWNPVFWLAAARFKSLCEQSCDAFAIRRLEGQPTRGYGELLLSLSQRRASRLAWRVRLPASMLGFVSSYFRKRSLVHRLKALRSAGMTRGRWHTAGVAALVGLLALSGLTDASTSKQPLNQSKDWLPPSITSERANWTSAAPVDPGPIVTRTHDVEKALARIAAGAVSGDVARAELYSYFVHLVRSGAGQYHALTNEWAQERVKLDGCVLTAHVSPGLHDEIARSISAIERSGMMQICLQPFFLAAERDIASALGVAWRYPETALADREDDFPLETKIGELRVRAKASVDDYLPIAVAIVNDQQVTALVEATQTDRDANLIQGPKITVFGGQTATIQDCTQTPFVVGMRAAAGGAPQPEIAVIDEGIKISLRAAPGSDATKTRLEGRVEFSEILEVCTALTLHRDEPTTIQTPRVLRRRIDVSGEAPDGHSLLIGCTPTHGQTRFFYVLLTTRIVREPAPMPH